ncbi:hypothetical protein C5167_032923 [Papaver somniferum]|uniref:APO domain-containing protein n=1 Tax=Papaver somniferum TaxID=3469 RepID=A0A4Y7KCB7_PAPSO|nr:APO protein 2, chloroplastic-like [Papaver somniferum]RZC69791.1 hypothetical protein C5167_032923 [Papaver somniferum]
MSCGFAHSPAAITALIHPSKFESVRVSYHTKCKCLKSKLYQNLAYLGSFKFNGCEVELPPQIAFQPHPNVFLIKGNHPQNADFPRCYSKKEKKPFPIPVLELRRAARERQKSRKGKPRKPVVPPRNGMLIRRLIPVAYEVFNSRIKLINNLKRLLKVVPVHACKWCNEIHVGPVGHPFKSCRGQQTERRKGRHEWIQATIEDIFLPVDAFHLFDRLGPRIPHEERFSTPRVPALVELCVQAGVDLPDLPTKRRRKPVIRIGKSEIIDANEDDLVEETFTPEFNEIIDASEDNLVEEDIALVVPETYTLHDILPDSEIQSPSNAEELALLSEETVEAWDKMRQGAKKLMRKYLVRVCGYCPEVHVGPSGHKAQNCGAYKHQQRNGQHGWQAATLDDLIPPRYVWHVPDVRGPPLQRELRNFYGQAPAVVEICVQGGAVAPEDYRSTMRLDVGIPIDIKEVEMVV